MWRNREEDNYDITEYRSSPVGTTLCGADLQSRNTLVMELIVYWFIG